MPLLVEKNGGRNKESIYVQPGGKYSISNVHQDSRMTQQQGPEDLWLSVCRALITEYDLLPREM